MGFTYVVACHYSLIALFSVVFCVLLYVANKLSLICSVFTSGCIADSALCL